MQQHRAFPARLLHGNLHCLWDVEPLLPLHLPPQIRGLFHVQIGTGLGASVLLGTARIPSEKLTEDLCCLQFTDLPLAPGINPPYGHGAPP